MTDLLQLQIEREEASRAAGVARYNASLDNAAEHGRLASTGPAVKLQKEFINTAADAIERYVGSLRAENRTAFRASVLECLGSEHTAYLTIQHLLNGLGTKEATVRRALGQDIEDNVNLALMMKNPETAGLAKYLDKDKYKGADATIKAYGMDRARRKAFGVEAKKDQLKRKESEAITNENGKVLTYVMAREDRAALAQALMYVVIDSLAGFVYKAEEDERTGLVYVDSVSEFKHGEVKIVNFIQPTPQFVRYCSEANAKLELMRPVHEPMLVPPNPWISFNDGGYYGTRMALIKSVPDEVQAKWDAQGSLEALKFTVNTLQNTAYQFNPFVYETMAALWEAGTPLKIWTMPVRVNPESKERKEPIKFRLDMPAAPAGCKGNEEVFKETNPEAWRRYMWQRGECHRFNESTARLLKVSKIENRLAYVRNHILVGNVSMYEVWQADNRLRLYPTASLLTTQGDDTCKALFEYVKKVPLGEHGAWWLAIHVANTWANDSIDKEKRISRVKWVLANEDRIYQAGTDPLANLWWTEADGGKKPWCFLRACREYALYLQQGSSFESNIVVSIDGSANGLQHYCALLRSETEGPLVNLAPSEVIQDMYRIVAGLTVSKLRKSDSPYAGYLLAELAKRDDGGRGVSKHPTMTFAYAISYAGIREMIQNKNEELFQKFKDEKDRQGLREASALIAKLMYESIKETVPGAEKGMRFLRSLVEGATGAITWTLPDGCIARQHYTHSEMKYVQTVVSGSIRVKQDRGAVIRDEIAKLGGVTQNSVYKANADFSRAAARKRNQAAKLFLKESHVLKLYRDETINLINSYGDFNLKDFCVSRFKQINLMPVPELYDLVCEMMGSVVADVMERLRVPDEVLDPNSDEVAVPKDRKFDILEFFPTTDIDVNGMSRGIGANLIHSLDACHLRMTVKRGVTAGITDFTMVHDSFGCHAGNMAELDKLTRESFIELHSELLLEKFGAELVVQGELKQEVLDEAVAKLEYGTLDLNLVRESEGFFG